MGCNGGGYPRFRLKCNLTIKAFRLARRSRMPRCQAFLWPETPWVPITTVLTKMTAKSILQRLRREPCKISVVLAVLPHQNAANAKATATMILTAMPDCIVFSEIGRAKWCQDVKRVAVGMSKITTIAVGVWCRPCKVFVALAPPPHAAMMNNSELCEVDKTVWDLFENTSCHLHRRSAEDPWKIR